MNYHGYTATEVWLDLLQDLTSLGVSHHARGMPTYELLNSVQLQVDMRAPVVNVPARKLNYRFMAAEALWILEGQNELAPLLEVNPRMATFSDDGKTLAGAYGVPFNDQLDYVVQALLKDPGTRQATMTIWRPVPAPSKDIPCTVAMNFSLRDEKLYSHVFMRSSDVWLGVPYDIFSFTMMAARVAQRYNHMVAARGGHWEDTRPPVSLGRLTMTLCSSHLYAENLPAAMEILQASNQVVVPEGQDMPMSLVQGGYDDLTDPLYWCKHEPVGSRHPVWTIRP